MQYRDYTIWDMMYILAFTLAGLKEKTNFSEAPIIKIAI